MGKRGEYILIWTLDYKVIKRAVSILILHLVRASKADSMAIGTRALMVREKVLRNKEDRLVRS